MLRGFAESGVIAPKVVALPKQRRSSFTRAFGINEADAEASKSAEAGAGASATAGGAADSGKRRRSFFSRAFGGGNDEAEAAGGTTPPASPSSAAEEAAGGGARQPAKPRLSFSGLGGRSTKLQVGWSQCNHSMGASLSTKLQGMTREAERDAALRSLMARYVPPAVQLKINAGQAPEALAEIRTISVAFIKVCARAE